MMKIFIKRWQKVLISLSVLLLGYVVAKACGWYDLDDRPTSNYAPEVFVKEEYKPFFYASYTFYYDGDYDYYNEESNPLKNQNTSEWSSFLGKDFSKPALSFLLNEASTKVVLATAEFYTNKGELPDTLRLYASGFNRNNSKQKAFLHYLRIAKACEQFATNDGTGVWSYEKGKKQLQEENAKNNISVTSAVLQKELDEATEPFIKQRYWFQLVRYNFFNDLAATTTVFENTKSKYEQNTMYYRTMAYVAGAYYKQKNYSKANYYYSIVFAKSDELKKVAHWSFHPQEEADWQQTLAMCANNKERIVLWQMLGIFYNDEMRSMQEIYKLDPSDAAIDLLLTRMINKLESADEPSAKAIAEDFIWCQKVSKENKINNPFLWNISTGYLAFLNNDFATAKNYYDIAAKKMPNTSLAKDQLRLLQLLNKVETIKTITAKEEQTLLPEFEWLYKLNADSNVTGDLRYTNAQNAIKAAMSKKYASQGDMVKSECFLTNATFYALDKNVNDLKAFLSKSNPSKYEALCQKFSVKSLIDLWEYQSVQATFKDDLDNAILLMTKAEGNGDVVLAGNPFNGKIQDCHDCDHVQKQKVKYTKLAFLQKMKELKDNVVAKKDVYNNALLLANGYYNITHFGNARYFYEGVVLGSDHSDPEMIDSVFRRMLTDNSLANKYYKIALQNAADDEQRAKSLYMIAKCERNDWYRKNIFDFSGSYSYRENNNDVDFIKWDAFSSLSKYKHTKYYKDIIAECGYFKTAMSH